ncbi:uncharacterized protein LOC106078246 isoform X1 [Biomphalaria glabrata]|uniref:Neutral ceramidase n=2 Tax=Biomphalaria glabrata TaxID=6526 RepID=A0A9U8EM52_BIOGL|nr:uncharacterized protein LOC106078246 isoform X1 [Biomphalaria glabrata]
MATTISVLIRLHYLPVLLLIFTIPNSKSYYVGVGIADITGPAAEVNMMGYANPGQTSHGIHLRQFSRAFIFAESLSSKRTVFVSLDACWSPGAVKRLVVQILKNKFGDLYTERNIAVSGTHTHGGSGGFSQYLLFDLTALGFNQQNFGALVDGTLQSIINAHENLQPADIFMNSGELLDSNINRSPTAYLNNPAEERSKYKYDVDKEMVVLKFVNQTGHGIGMISWFAVHGTSMNNTNKMLTSDNKGYASLLFEQQFNPGALPGKGTFVAAFAQSNLGDVSPNTKGPHCLDTGLPCDAITSTCNGKNELCVAFGPGKDMFESTQIIANNQYQKALELYNSAQIKITGPVDFRHSYINMTQQVVPLANGTKVQTCKPAMGYSFAAGTTDGPGAFDFKQGSNSSNPFWNLVRDLIKEPTENQKRCHFPKPILLDTGEISLPYLWQPQIVDNQILRIGQFVIIAVPGEFTTMSGRRMRDNVYLALTSQGFPADTKTVIAGLANEYADYIATYEEYQQQRYEAASTIFGPHTLEAYLQTFRSLAIQMAQGQPSPPGPTPPNQLDKQISLLPGVIFDSAPSGTQFGSVVKDAESTYTAGSTVTVTFVSANPRNDLRTGDTFLTVEHKENGDNWVVLYADANWETRFKWVQTSLILGHSQAEIMWEIPKDQIPGVYRIRHFGTSKSIIGSKTPFVGQTKEFTVVNSNNPYLYQIIQM